MIDNPYSSFDIKGKVALVVGATGAFGSVATRTYAGAGCKVAITGGNKSELEKISDVSKVEIAGVEEKEIAIMVNPFALEARNLSFTDIENAVKFENISISSGNLLENDMRRSVRLIGEFKEIEDIENVIISNRNDKIVFLKDVADIQ